jgi:hypothetical protein
MENNIDLFCVSSLNRILLTVPVQAASGTRQVSCLWWLQAVFLSWEYHSASNHYIIKLACLFLFLILNILFFYIPHVRERVFGVAHGLHSFLALHSLQCTESERGEQIREIGSTERVKGER